MKRPQSLVFVGVVLAALAVMLYFQLGKIAELVSWTVLKWIVALCFAVISMGLLVVFTGACMWARRAPVSQVPYVAGPILIISILLGISGSLNTHLPTGILFVAVLVAVPGGAAMMLIALRRWLRTGQSSNMSS